MSVVYPIRYLQGEAQQYAPFLDCLVAARCAAVVDGSRLRCYYMHSLAYWIPYRCDHNMIALSEALATLDRAARPFPTEELPVQSSLGRMLVEPIRAESDIPAFSRSAMDGFAVRRSDLSDTLTITETVAAGQVPSGPLEPGTAVRIMTGAEVPEGADLVVRVEYAEVGDRSVRFTDTERGSNIVHRGENAMAGDTVLAPRLMRPHDVGVAAAHGRDRVTVLASPRVGIISTGDELREPGAVLDRGSIYNSNGGQLMAQARSYGCEARSYGIATDSPAALRKLLEPALAENDIVLLSGGVSMGEFDYVPGLLADVGVKTQFHRVAMKPGRPTFFGTREADVDGASYVFGLPGNPVSVFVSFEVFVRRLIYRMAGLDGTWNTFPTSMAVTHEVKDRERAEFLPVTLRDGGATPVRYGGSSHLSALSAADALLEIPVGTQRIEEGASIRVRPL